MPSRAMPAPDGSSLLQSPAFEITAFLLGLVVGSFANVCIHRLPRAIDESDSGRVAWARRVWRQLRSIGYPPSRCPRCGLRIRPWDNVPVLSFLALRGRCRDCETPIPWRYPAVEAANGLLWLAIALLRGPTVSALVAMALVTALLVLSLIDLEHQLLPDSITLPGIALGVGASFLPGSPIGPLAAVAAAAGGWLSFALLAFAWKKLRDVDALGEGDWKMAAMLGAFFGWERMLLTVLLASVAGSLIGIGMMLAARGGWRSQLPLGTFLGIAGIAMVVFGDGILGFYQALSAVLIEPIPPLGRAAG
jgi:leader peptidase (prepilin peptidase)/N-methyltransferase